MTLVCSSVSFPRSPACVNTQVRHDLLAKGLSVTRTELLSRAVARGAQEHFLDSKWEIHRKAWENDDYSHMFHMNPLNPY